MTKIPIFQVDAFADKVFSGNPAAVCPIMQELDESQMQHIAAENNLSETAFIKIDTELPDSRGSPDSANRLL